MDLRKTSNQSKDRIILKLNVWHIFFIFFYSFNRNDLTKYAIPRAHLTNEDPSSSNGAAGTSHAEDNHNSTWELLSGLDVPIRKKHKGQTLKALLRVRGINMLRDPMAVFFQVFMPVAFGMIFKKLIWFSINSLFFCYAAALGIWLGTLQTKRVVETKRPFSLGNRFLS